jgi:hypothetical protein
MSSVVYILDFSQISWWSYDTTTAGYFNPATFPIPTEFGDTDDPSEPRWIGGKILLKVSNYNVFTLVSSK